MRDARGARGRTERITRVIMTSEDSKYELAGEWFRTMMEEREEIALKHRKLLRDPTLWELTALMFNSCRLVSRCIKEPLERGLRDRSEIPKVALATLGVHLLLTAYDTATQGRFGAAGHVMRSLSEVPDFLLAAHFDEDFGWEWWTDTVNPPRIARARKIAAAGIKRFDEGASKEWESLRSMFHEWVQPLSHVSARTARISILAVPGQTRVEVGAVGIAEPHRFRSQVIGIHWWSWELLRACYEAMAGMVHAPEDWEREASEVLTRGKKVVPKIMSELYAFVQDFIAAEPALRDRLQADRQALDDRVRKRRKKR